MSRQENWPDRHSVFVLGSGADYVFIREEDTLTDQQRVIEDAVSKGFFHCGTIRVEAGELFVVLTALPSAVLPMQLAVSAFAESVGMPWLARLSAQRLEQLRALPDTRA